MVFHAKFHYAGLQENQMRRFDPLLKDDLSFRKVPPKRTLLKGKEFIRFDILAAYYLEKTMSAVCVTMMV